MPRNIQVVETGTEHPCRQCGTVFTVAQNPFRSGWFCSRSCALRFSRQSIRSTEQRRLDRRLKSEQSAIEAARIKAEHDAEQLQKSNAALREFQLLQDATEAAT